jgi:hypothetical protein
MKITDRIRYAFWLGWWQFKRKYMTPLESAQQALSGLAQAVSNAKSRHTQADTQLAAQLAQAKAELTQQQTRAQAAENALVALTAEVQKHIANINAS